MARADLLRWRGPGATAFAMAGASPEPVVSPVVARCETREAFALAVGALADPDPGTEAQRYFSAGGRGCRVLCDARFRDDAWVGEDAGSGARTGIHALADSDEIGTIVIPGPSSVRREEQVVDLAARHPGIFFLLEGEAGRGSRLLYLLPNVAVLATRGIPTGDVSTVGELAAWLETSDWSEEVSFRREPPRLPRGLARGDVAPALAWRRRQGLRRSIDLGTRWILFELSQPPLWRSVERETKAFLYRLERDGFFEGRGADALDVACVPSAEIDTGDGEAEEETRDGADRAIDSGATCLKLRVRTGALARGPADGEPAPTRDENFFERS